MTFSRSSSSLERNSRSILMDLKGSGRHCWVEV